MKAVFFILLILLNEEPRQLDAANGNLSKKVFGRKRLIFFVLSFSISSLDFWIACQLAPSLRRNAMDEMEVSWDQNYKRTF